MRINMHLSDLAFNNQQLLEAMSNSDYDEQDPDVIEAAESLACNFTGLGHETTSQEIIADFIGRV